MTRRRHRHRRDTESRPSPYRVRLATHAGGVTWTVVRHGAFASGGEAPTEREALRAAQHAADRHARRHGIGTHAALRDATPLSGTVPLHAVLRVVDAQTVRYYRATYTGKWKGNYGGTVPDIRYDVRSESTQAWTAAATAGVPRRVREQLQLRLKGWETPNTLTLASARDAGFDKKALHKDIDRGLRAAEKTKLRTLRADLQRVRAEDKARCAAAKDTSRAQLVRLRERAARIVLQIRKLRLRIRHAKARACSPQSASHQDALRAERAYQASLHRSRQAAQKRRPGVRSTRAERGQESDDAVRHNLEPHLIPLWNRVKKGITGTGRKSRTEAFLQYVEEHPDEVYADSDDATDALIAQLERRQRTGRDRSRRQ